MRRDPWCIKSLQCIRNFRVIRVTKSGPQANPDAFAGRASQHALATVGRQRYAAPNPDGLGGHRGVMAAGRRSTSHRARLRPRNADTVGLHVVYRRRLQPCITAGYEDPGDGVATVGGCGFRSPVEPSFTAFAAAVLGDDVVPGRRSAPTSHPVRSETKRSRWRKARSACVSRLLDQGNRRDDSGPPNASGHLACGIGLSGVLQYRRQSTENDHDCDGRDFRAIAR